MLTYESYLFKDWNKIRKNVKRGLNRLGHDIKLVNHESEMDVLLENENEKYIQTGEMISWWNPRSKQKETGMVVAIIRSGESAKKCVPRHIKKSHANFQDISNIDRVLIAVSDEERDNKIRYLCPHYGTVKASVRMAEDAN